MLLPILLLLLSSIRGTSGSNNPYGVVLIASEDTPVESVDEEEDGDVMVGLAHAMELTHVHGDILYINRSLIDDSLVEEKGKEAAGEVSGADALVLKPSIRSERDVS